MQSSIEETLQRIKSTEGVQGFVIVDQNGGILRKSDSFSDEQSTQSGALIDDLTRMAMGAVRDLDARVRLSCARVVKGSWAGRIVAYFLAASQEPLLTVRCLSTRLFAESAGIPSPSIGET